MPSSGPRVLMCIFSMETYKEHPHSERWKTRVELILDELQLDTLLTPCLSVAKRSSYWVPVGSENIHWYCGIFRHYWYAPRVLFFRGPCLHVCRCDCGFARVNDVSYALGYSFDWQGFMRLSMALGWKIWCYALRATCFLFCLCHIFLFYLIFLLLFSNVFFAT